MDVAVTKAIGSTGATWLRGAPKCRREGPMVHVTLDLAPCALKKQASVAWSAGGLHATTPMISGAVVTCSMPHGLFERRAIVNLELLASSDSEQPVLAWTQFAVLAQTLFQAGLQAGAPVLRPIRAGDGPLPVPSRRERARSVSLLME